MFYTAKITKEDDGYSVEFPDVPGAFSDGDTLKEAFANAEEALNGVLACMLDRKDPLPVAKVKANSKRGLYEISVNNRLAVSYSIFEARRGKSAAEISRKMGITRQAYQRLENPKASLSVATLEKFANATEKKLEIRFI